MCSLMSCLLSGGSSTSFKKYCDTLNKASCGHGKNQSIVLHDTSPGNARHRPRSVSPAGDIPSTICRLLRIWLMAKPHIWDSWYPSSRAFVRTACSSGSFSSSPKSAGTIPTVKMLFTYSKKPSSTTWASVNKNEVGTLITSLYMVFKSSLMFSSPYPRDRTISKRRNPAVKVANLVRLCLPLPPTPTRRALPRGMRITRWRRTTWARASTNRTRFMTLCSTLYSSRIASITPFTLSKLSKSSYIRSSVHGVSDDVKIFSASLKSPKIRGSASAMSAILPNCSRIIAGSFVAPTNALSSSVLSLSS
mmetsp:Transcript_85890/g.195814  ORF Transcript_85890/g.195814 Transcript_85890/m.195814 type:complete len:306 (-) Transcript_85890:1825-2742(-)